MTSPIHLPETTISADEFIALLEAILNAETEESTKLAAARFKAKMNEIARNQRAAKGGAHCDN